MSVNDDWVPNPPEEEDFEEMFSSLLIICAMVGLGYGFCFLIKLIF